MKDYFIILFCISIFVAILRLARERYDTRMYAQTFHITGDDDYYKIYIHNSLRAQ
jgi:hypothetical protein